MSSATARRISKKQKELGVSKKNAFENDEGMRAVIIDAFGFIDVMSSYVPIFIKEPNHEAITIAISMLMRRKLSRATIYATLQILMQLSEYLDESKFAFDEERTPGLPKPKNHLDYTIYSVWKDWVKIIESEQEVEMEWNTAAEHNPYTTVTEAIDQLISRVWEYHFNVKDL